MYPDVDAGIARSVKSMVPEVLPWAHLFGHTADFQWGRLVSAVRATRYVTHNSDVFCFATQHITDTSPRWCESFGPLRASP